jgi:hypothetical protein
MTPSEYLSPEPGVLAVAYPFPASPLVEVVDAERVTTGETFLPRRIEQRCPTHAEYDAALTDLGYTRTSTWRQRHGLAFCDVTVTDT